MDLLGFVVGFVFGVCLRFPRGLIVHSICGGSYT